MFGKEHHPQDHEGEAVPKAPWLSRYFATALIGDRQTNIFVTRVIHFVEGI